MSNEIRFYSKKLLTIDFELNCESNSSFGLVLDGTKDSGKVTCYSFTKYDIEPYTIAQYLDTGEWFVVSSCKRHNLQNEQGFVYCYDIELLGAIEILNARDLTDCGFNQKTYTIGDFIQRIISLSTFEIPINIIANSNIDLTKQVDYLKTFENYTPLSALREFLDGYNCCSKMTFNTNALSENITSANIVICSKTGEVSKPTIDISFFDDVREISDINKNSFGTTVVSNAENVISTKTKTYPTNGGIKLSADEYKITNTNALIRLPSPAYKVNWIRMVKLAPITIWEREEHIVDDLPVYEYTKVKTFIYDPTIQGSMEEAYSLTRNYLDDNYGASAEVGFLTNIKLEDLKEEGNKTIYYEDKYDPQKETFISNNIINKFIVGFAERDLVLTDNETAQGVDMPSPSGLIVYERGKDTIKGFEWFYESGGTIVRFNKTWNSKKYVYSNIIVTLGNWKLDNDGIPQEDTTENYSLTNARFIINYIPMNDLKIKLDNYNDRHDTKLFNQNGKLTDSNALSKQLLSYVKEIESDTITRYKHFYNYNDIPSVGTIVMVEEVPYVINNINYELCVNENETHYYDCEFSMSKKVAVKSTMVNPNTNIRDYGIPQNHNVKRKQVYRDFYELTFVSDQVAESTPYLKLDKVLNINNNVMQYNEHTAVIKLTFKEEYGGGETIVGGGNSTSVMVNPSKEWYYQIESTTYTLKKSIYEVFDFKDNNIIGYGCQNVWCGFVVKRLFTNQIDTINTPISYVDDDGQFKDIDILCCNSSQIYDIYEEYKNEIEQAENDTVKYTLYNFSCFIPSEIFTKAQSNHDFEIEEENYKKDATEVPVFEYGCQIDDTDDVTVGENIFVSNEDDIAYLYTFDLVPKNVSNEDNYVGLTTMSEITISNNVATSTMYAKMYYANNVGELEIQLYRNVSLDLNSENKVATPTNRVSINTLDFENNDLAITRRIITKDNITYPTIGTLVSNKVYSDLPTPLEQYRGSMAIKTNDKCYTCELENADYYLYTTQVVPVARVIDNANVGYINPVVGKSILTYGTQYTFPSVADTIEIYRNVVYNENNRPTYAQVGNKKIVAFIQVPTNLPSAQDTKEMYSLDVPNANRLNTNYQGEIGKHMVAYNQVATNIPQSYYELYALQTYGINNMPSQTADTLGKNIVCKEEITEPSSGIQSIQLDSTGIYSPSHLPSNGYVGNAIAVRLTDYDVNNIRLYQYVSGPGYVPTNIYLMQNGVNVAQGMYFKKYGTNKYYYWGNSLWREYKVTNYYLYESITLGNDWELVNGVNPNNVYYKYNSNYYTYGNGSFTQYEITYSNVYKLYECTQSYNWVETPDDLNDIYFLMSGSYYTWNGVGYSNYTINYVGHYYLQHYDTNENKWVNDSEMPTTSSKYYKVSTYQYYQWILNNFTPYQLPTTTVYRLYECYNLAIGWEMVQATWGNKIFRYLNDNYTWSFDNPMTFTKHNEYSWEDFGSAIGKYFLYQNSTYGYNNSTKKTYVVATKTDIGHELMFIIRNLDTYEITDNKITLKINHYKLK